MKLLYKYLSLHLPLEKRAGRILTRTFTPVLLTLIITFAPCSAQNATDDFTKMNKAYIKANHITMKVKYEVFKDITGNQAAETQLGEIKRNGDSKYERIGEMENLRTKDYDMIVDNDAKKIILLKQESSKPLIDESLISNIGESLKQCEKVEFKKENSSQNSYTLSYKEGDYRHVKIIYNSKTFLVEKMVLLYREETNFNNDDDEHPDRHTPRMDITYYDINTNPALAPADFTYDNYVSAKDNKLVCQAKYKTYTLQNLLKQ